MQRLPGLRGHLLRLSRDAEIQQQQSGEIPYPGDSRPLRESMFLCTPAIMPRPNVSGRDKYTIDGKEYDECGFCRASCPSRDLFKEPDSGLPLKCDMCEGEDEPMCVKWCLVDALTYVEREEEVERKRMKRDEIEIGLESLVNKHGIDKVVDTVAQLSKTLKR